MALSQADVLEVVRASLEDIEDLLAVYAPSQPSVDKGGVPMTLAGADMPCAIVLPGESTRYILQPGRQRHDYRVRVLLFIGGMDYAEAAYVGGPLPDQVIGEMLTHVTANGYANLLLFERGTGLGALEWAGNEYLGYEFIFKVSEAASATPATGE